MTILDKLVACTRERLEEDRRRLPPEALERAAAPCKTPFAFERALAKPGLSFICEVKRASPSKGLIAPDFPYLQIAREYEEAGADAISVLTEPEYFQGRDEYLTGISGAVQVPLLRKDFTVDEYQVYQARAIGASALLLICAILEEAQVREFIALADTLGMSCLVEAHDEEELTVALRAGARIIGVNNRDLKTFQVDLNNSIRLRKLAPPEVLFVSESGMRTRQDIVLLEQNGVDAALVGETLMRSPDKKRELDLLRGTSHG